MNERVMQIREDVKMVVAGVTKTPASLKAPGQCGDV